ncbi:MAG: pyridoxamine 5'-phosphate oxidase family protein [Desulfobacteraceae bacterium]|nr:pyridoxamine 5'-phosphate oxidase family protein [Desulfobacteraceae bacterium]
MRRKDKQILNQSKIERILQNGSILHIAMIDEKIPYLIPVNYGYIDNAIYIHCAKEGKKIDIIKKNNIICFQTEIGVEIKNTDIAYKCGTLYQSVLGYGKAHFIDTPKEKKIGSDAIMNQYFKKRGSNHKYGKCLKEVCIIKIDIDSISGKESLDSHLD